MSKTYIGDSVYADFDGYELTLTTENGSPYGPSNVIVLGPQELQSLNLFLESERQKLSSPAP